MAFRMDIGPLELKFAHPFGLSRWTTRSSTNVLVKLEKDGVVGWGEGAPNRRYGERFEQDVLFLEKWSGLEVKSEAEIPRFLETLSADPQVPASAAAAMDMALHDWMGHATGRPVYAVLGFPAPAPHVTTFTIGIDEPEIMSAKVEQAADFQVYKIKVGTERDEEIIQAIRSVTDKPLRVDANEGWKDRDVAAARIEWLSEQGVELVEQPLPAGRLEDVAWLAERSPVPLLADEDCRHAADLARLAGVYAGVNIKLDKCGGLLEAAKMVRQARASGLSVMLGCMVCSSLSSTAAFHLAGLADYIDLDGHLLLDEDPFDGIGCTEGRLHLSVRSGIGAVPRRLPAA